MSTPAIFANTVRQSCDDPSTNDLFEQAASVRLEWCFNLIAAST